MIRLVVLVLVVSLLPSCNSFLHNIHKRQSDKKLSKTEVSNFASEKAATQWWYFDMFFDDGSVLVLMFVPHHWWGDPEKESDAKTLIYASYMRSNGDVITSEKIVDPGDVIYDENGLKSPFLEISKAHDQDSREYTVNFFLDEINGTTKIISDTKAFSPLPSGKLGSFGTKVLLGKKGKNIAYRYAAHVPQGTVTSDLMVDGTPVVQSGKVYHEQGWFTGQPHQMGEGWVWFHFISKDINLFGAKTFLYLKREEEVIVGGLHGLGSKSMILDSVFNTTHPNLLVGGKLSYSSPNMTVDIVPTGEKTTPLIYIPSEETNQVWGNVLQPSTIKIMYRGEEIRTDGMMLIETCRMSK